MKNPTRVNFSASVCVLPRLALLGSVLLVNGCAAPANGDGDEGRDGVVSAQDAAGPRDTREKRDTGPSSDRADGASGGVAVDVSAPDRNGDGGDDNGSKLSDANGPAADSGGTTSTGTGKPDFAVGNGLVVWLDANDGVTRSGDAVTRWHDLSGMNNDAVADPGREPLAALVGGVGAVHFKGKATTTMSQKFSGHDGPYLRIKDSASLRFGQDDWSITFVAGYSNEIDASHNGVIGMLWSKYVPGGPVMINFAGNWPVAENPNVEKSFLFVSLGEGGPAGFSSKREGLNDGKVRIYGLRKKGTTLELRINGRVDASRSDGSYAANFDISKPGLGDVALGGIFLDPTGATATRAFKGDMLMVIAVRGKFGDDAVAALESHLAKRFMVAP